MNKTLCNVHVHVHVCMYIHLHVCMYIHLHVISVQVHIYKLNGVPLFFASLDMYTCHAGVVYRSCTKHS